LGPRLCLGGCFRRLHQESTKRRHTGVTPRQIYLEQSLSKQRPWEREGVSRRTWERRRARVASVSRTKLLLGADGLASPPNGQHVDSAPSIVSVQAPDVQRVEDKRKPRKLNGQTCDKASKLNGRACVKSNAKDDSKKIWRAPRILTDEPREDFEGGRRERA
jgi:hypothetical protein